MSQQRHHYICPMHPDVVREIPGRCPECGMELVLDRGAWSKHQHPAEHAPAPADKHAGHHTEAFLRKFWLSLALTIPVVLYSGIIAETFGWQAPSFPGSAFLPAVFGSVVFFYGGWVFLVGASREIRGRLPGMMTLIALAISAAYGYSALVTITGQGEPLFWELTTLITVMLLGHWIEMRAVSGAQGALRELSKLLPDTAEVVVSPSETKTVPLVDLRIGDRLIVRPGGRIPTDGVVVEGRSDVNEAMVTGESAPVVKHPESEVIAGTVNGDGVLTLRVARVGDATFLAGVMRLVAEAQASKSRLQVLSDRAALYLTIIAITTGAITFGAWIVAQAGFSFAVERLVAVLVIACPHALGLAVPLVASISTTLAARNGFLVRQRLALEAARNVNVVLFDKTGTLTKGEYGVQALWASELGREAEMLQLAASVDASSEHVIARAIVAEAKARGVSLRAVVDFMRLPGQGVRGIVDGTEVVVGGVTALEAANASVPALITDEVAQANQRGQTVVFVLVGSTVVGAIALADVIRDESREAVASLKAMGVRVAMVTGDSEAVAAWVAGELGIDETFARVLPHEKAEIIRKLQASSTKRIENWKLEIENSRRRRVVAMVGDGINDAPALTQADVGIAIGAGTNVAIESAGIILVRNDPRDIPKIIRLSRRTYAKMVQNLFWATGYNVVALPLAAGALAWRGIVLEPAVAALFMSLSTVIVAINAMLLRRTHL